MLHVLNVKWWLDAFSRTCTRATRFGLAPPASGKDQDLTRPHCIDTANHVLQKGRKLPCTSSHSPIGSRSQFEGLPVAPGGCWTWREQSPMSSVRSLLNILPTNFMDMASCTTASLPRLPPFASLPSSLPSFFWLAVFLLLPLAAGPALRALQLRAFC